MSMFSPYVVVLTAAEDAALAARVASGRTEYRDRIRAQIVLEAAHGASNTAIAQSRTCAWTRCGPGGGGSPPRPATDWLH